MVLPSFLFNIWGKSVQRFLSYDLKYEQTSTDTQTNRDYIVYTIDMIIKNIWLQYIQIFYIYIDK